MSKRAYYIFKVTRTFLIFFFLSFLLVCDTTTFTEVYFKISKIVHYNTGVEGDYLMHETFFARAKRVRKVECGKNHLTYYSVIQYFIPREPNNHIKVMILRLEWYKHYLYHSTSKS